MSLPRRRLGNTDLQLTRVGLGAWAIGGGGWAYGWGEQDDAQSIATIRHGVESGLNWIDTAAYYGLGHSEQIVGRALREIPSAQRPLVFTKCGLQFDEQTPHAQPLRNLKPASIRRELEASLRRLGVDCIDLYQCHWPDDATPVAETWAEMARFVEEGKVRAIGVSNFSVEQLEQAEAVRHVDSLQPPFSLIRPGAGSDVIPWSKAHGTGVIVYSPLQSGILTESFSRERLAAMAADDWRRGSSDFQEPKLTQNLALRDRLRPIAERHGVSVSAVAIAWTTQFPGVTGAIVGARSPEQLDGWLAAASLELSPNELATLSSPAT